MTAAATDPRLIDPGVPPTRFARGWHCLGLADTYRDGKETEGWTATSDAVAVTRLKRAGAVIR